MIIEMKKWSEAIIDSILSGIMPWLRSNLTEIIDKINSRIFSYNFVDSWNSYFVYENLETKFMWESLLDFRIIPTVYTIFLLTSWLYFKFYKKDYGFAEKNYIAMRIFIFYILFAFQIIMSSIVLMFSCLFMPFTGSWLYIFFAFGNFFTGPSIIHVFLPIYSLFIVVFTLPFTRHYSKRIRNDLDDLMKIAFNILNVVQLFKSYKLIVTLITIFTFASNIQFIKHIGLFIIENCHFGLLFTHTLPYNIDQGFILNFSQKYFWSFLSKNIFPLLILALASIVFTMAISKLLPYCKNLVFWVMFRERSIENAKHQNKSDYFEIRTLMDMDAYKLNNYYGI